MPAHPYVLRARSSTAVSSQNTIAAPPSANLPRCTRCQSVGPPSSDEYWHIGDTTTRLRAVRPRGGRGKKNSGAAAAFDIAPATLDQGGARALNAPAGFLQRREIGRNRE